MSRGRSSPRVVVKESTNARAIELSRVRLMCVALFFALCFVSINVRLIELMISAPHTLPRMFPQRILSELTEPEDLEVSVKQERLKRGDFVDRNGVLVATSLMTASAYANPREISGPENVALKLEKAIGVPHDVLLKRLKSSLHINNDQSKKQLSMLKRWKLSMRKQESWLE